MEPPVVSPAKQSASVQWVQMLTFLKHLIFGDDLEGFIIRTAGAGSVGTLIYARTYAEPSIFAVFLILCGMTLLIDLIANKRAHPILKALPPALMIVCGVAILVNAESVELFLLDNLSTFKLSSAVRPKKVLHEYLEMKGFPEVGRIVLHSRSPRNQAVVVEPNENETQTLENLLFTSKGSLFFLTGYANSAKEATVERWAYLLSKSQTGFKYVFLIKDTEIIGALQDKKSGWPDWISSSYKGVLDSPDYYDLLFQHEPCLIVFYGLHRIKEEETRKRIIAASWDLVKQTKYHATILIGSRAEAVLRDNIANNIIQQQAVLVNVLSIEGLGEQDWTAYFDHPNPGVGTRSQFEAARRLLAQNAFIRALAVNRDTLNELVKNSTKLSKLQFNLDIAHVLIDEPMLQKAPDKFYDLALEASINEWPDLGLDHEELLYGSGVVMINEAYRYVFSPPVVQSYFAVKALEQRLTQSRSRNGSEDVLKQSLKLPLLIDLATLSPLPPQLRADLQNYFTVHADEVTQDSIAAWVQILGRDTVERSISAETAKRILLPGRTAAYSVTISR